MLRCRKCNCICDSADLLNGVCDDCREAERLQIEEAIKKRELMSSEQKQMEITDFMKGDINLRKIKLLKMTMQNFKSVKLREINFSDKTTIKGANRVGKTTIYSAFMWLLFDKDEFGNAAKNVRPHDENAVDIDFVDIVVEATLDVDGREITFKKIQKQNWVKKRGSEEKVFEGNVNEFEINGIPKKFADFKSYINENLAPEEVFFMCTNAQSFFRLDTKKRRAKLMELVKEFTDSDVISTDEKFLPLTDLLRDGTIEELIARSRGIIKKFSDNLKLIPARIDEQEKSKVEVNTEYLDLAKNAQKDKIAEIEAKEADLSKQYEEVNAIKDEVYTIKNQISELGRKANEENQNKKAELEVQKSNSKLQINEINRHIGLMKSDISNIENAIERNKTEIQKQGELWKQAKAREFDENSLICPYCGQSYSKEKQGQLKAEFEAHKAEELKRTVDKGNELKAIIEKDTAEIESLKELLINAEKQLQEMTKQHEELNAESSRIPANVDISETEEYKTLYAELEKKENILAQCDTGEDYRKLLKAEKDEAQKELDRINEELAKSQRNVDIDERIFELQAEQREISQKIADEERTRDLLEAFNTKKMGMLTEEVNKHFSVVKFVLFEKQINGGYADCCKVTVKGTNYEGGLNKGDRGLANIDILNTFQNINDVRLPIFFDDAEGTDEWRIPNIDTQLVLLCKTSDKEMIVEN